MDSNLPWTEEQIKSANEFQAAGIFHSFTCGTKEKHKVGDPDDLIATTNGWVCPSCDYTQNWAHGFMLDGSWKTFAPPWHPLAGKHDTD